MADKDNLLLGREIITKAVIAKGRKRATLTDQLSLKVQADGILGAWVTNHKINTAISVEGYVEVTGQFDIDVWYSYQSNQVTEVLRATIRYSEQIAVTSIGGEALGEEEVRVDVTLYPRCREATLQSKGNEIRIEVEIGFSAAILAECSLYVSLCPPGYDALGGGDTAVQLLEGELLDELEEIEEDEEDIL